jgi:membrane fusion protein, heavy metal efflux system
MDGPSGGVLRQTIQAALQLYAPPRTLLLWSGAGVAVLVAGAVVLGSHDRPNGKNHDAEISSQSKRTANRYRPTEIEWASLVVEPVEQRSFRPEQLTEGKISIDDNRSTPIFSPYSGRVTKLLVKAGDRIEKGQPLYVIEATETVQALSEFMAATSAVAKTNATLTWARTVEHRNRDLYDGRAVPLRDLQQARSDLNTAQNDARAAQTALEAARNRLRSLGKSAEDIAAFQDNGRISAETSIYAPISGTVVQRKVGLGQYVSASGGEPVFVIGDLSTVWLNVFVRETEATKVTTGQDVSFTVPALPDRTFSGKIEYVAAALDSQTRRMLVRASVDNDDGMLRPEMLANITIMARDEARSAAIPRHAVIYDGSSARVWVVREDKTIELRTIRTGLASGRMVQVLDGVSPGELVITKGNLFIDRAPPGS